MNKEARYMTGNKLGKTEDVLTSRDEGGDMVLEVRSRLFGMSQFF